MLLLETNLLLETLPHGGAILTNGLHAFCETLRNRRCLRRSGACRLKGMVSGGYFGACNGEAF